MTDKIRERLTGRNILILGFGREGRSTYRLLRSLFPGIYLTIADANPGIADDPLINSDKNLQLITEQEYLDSLFKFDIVIKSPGISLKDIDVPREKITSQTDLFLDAYGNQVIGVTGTKGKSTTSTLIHHIFEYSEQKSILLGNMGRPAFDHTEEIDQSAFVVYEMSSHQLEFLSSSPSVAILLNFYQEHLDAYRSYRDYRFSKWNISQFQDQNDVFIINADDQLVDEFLQEFPPKSRIFSFSMEKEVERGCFIRDNKIIFRDNIEMVILDLQKKRKLQGDHNVRNIMAAMIACIIKGIDPVLAEEAVYGFRGLEHRLEDCGIHGGVRFFNDSIATIPEASIAAVKALGEVDTIILGGFDRGIDYSGLAEFLSSSGIKNILFTGDAGRRIAEGFNPAKGQNVHMLSKFDDFIEVVRRVTPEGNICLLSPAAASYDEFQNFEIRGKRFKELIRITNNEYRITNTNNE